MAKKNNLGKYILSAGELGTYSVCPEAWRLTEIEKQKSLLSETAKQGSALHQNWAKKLDKLVFISKKLKILIALTILAIIIHIIVT